MQHHQEVCEMNQPRRGRPPTGIRKERLQVMLDPADHEALVLAAEARGETQAELGRKLVKGEASWADVERAARKARK
jgi:hypothetical protein